MQIIAHRGASGLAPENTLKAIRLALTLGLKPSRSTCSRPTASCGSSMTEDWNAAPTAAAC